MRTLHLSIPKLYRCGPQRTLEAGMVITYARPFVEARGNRLPKLSPARNLSAELNETHDELLLGRHTIYAHNTHNQLRRILELSNKQALTTWIQRPDQTLNEEWSSPTERVLADVTRLAAEHLDRFADEIDKIARRLAERG